MFKRGTFSGSLLLLVFLLFSCETKNPSKTIKHTLVPQAHRQILLVYSNQIPKKYIDTVHLHLQKAFGLEVELNLSPDLPKGLQSTVHQDRYRADSILRYLRSTYRGEAMKVLLLTHHDISTTKYSNFQEKKIKQPEHRYKDWAIFGLGSCPGYCCVVSVKRLWARKANEKTFLNRLKNITVHELGHTFGLPHCPVLHCVMNDANETIKTVDQSTGTFCAKCAQAI
jgi:archaemetzincin